LKTKRPPHVFHPTKYGLREDPSCTSGFVFDLPPKIRAFVAIRVSDAVEAALADFIDELRAPRGAVAWTHRDKLHITLKFLGPAVDSSKVVPLADSLERIARATNALEVRTRGVGGFPNLRRPRVLWAGLECESLALIAAEIENASRAAGFDASDRAWSPHLTLGRVRDPRKIKSILALMEKAADRDFGVSHVGEIVLYRSHLSSQGSRHEPLATFSLSQRVG
jgi:2'-5' RNA ligase